METQIQILLPSSWHLTPSGDLPNFVLHGPGSLGGPQGTENITPHF